MDLHVVGDSSDVIVVQGMSVLPAHPYDSVEMIISTPWGWEKIGKKHSYTPTKLLAEAYGIGSIISGELEDPRDEAEEIISKLGEKYGTNRGYN